MNKALILAGAFALACSPAFAADEHDHHEATPAKASSEPATPPPAAGAGMMDAKMMEHCKAMHEADRERLDRIDQRLEKIQRLLEQQAKARSKRG